MLIKNKEALNGCATVKSNEVDLIPDLAEDSGAIQAKKDSSVEYRYRISIDENIPSLEPDKSGKYEQLAPKGNVIITGLIKTDNTPNGEEWSQKPEKFESDYIIKSDGICFAKGLNTVFMKKMSDSFTVYTSWGAELQGKCGDYLTQYDVGNYGALAQEAFDAYYIEA